MKTLDDARVLAKRMVNIGKRFGRKVVAMITDMDQPLGNAVGNSIEVIEAIDTLKGNGPKDFTELCYNICAEMLTVSEVFTTKEEALIKIDEIVKSGTALEKLKQMIKYQHGNIDVINDYSIFGNAKEIIEVKSEISGYVRTIDTSDIGVSAMLLGAGREKITDVIDSVVGIMAYAKKGDYINKGDIIGKVYTNGKNTDKAIEMLRNAYKLTNEKIEKENIILDIIGE